MIGENLGHYRILELLGEGAMGAVYRAEDTRLGRQVALKVLPEDVTDDQARLERFQHEARTLAALDHPNIVTVYSVEECAGIHFLTMQLVEGHELRELIPPDGMAVRRFSEIAAALASGLAAAHSNGVIHRDLKPGNIMVSDEGRVTVLDFGLAKREAIEGTHRESGPPTQPLTQEGIILGTMPYMAPEQFDGKAADQRSDIFSLGIVLYEMATGERPFKGDTPISVASSIYSHVPEPAHKVRNEYPETLGAIINRCLEKDPADRFQSADEFLVELRRREEVPTTQMSAFSPTESPAAEPKSRWLFVAIVAALTVCVATFAMLVPRESRPSPAGNDRKSIAVLPFQNLAGEDEESDYFSIGVTEDILTMLGKIGKLRVIPSVATRRYETTQATPAEIGAELSVGSLLTGTVRRSGDRLRISCTLVDTDTSTQLWAETYDRETENVFEIQSEIARNIVDKLEAELSQEERDRIDLHPTTSLSAYDLYLKGREFYYRYNKNDNERAIELYQRAIDLDEAYALAFAGLADAYAQRAVRYGASFSWVDEARATAERAISLDPSSAEGYKALGLSYVYQGKFERGVEAYRRAIEINPNYFSAVSNAGAIYIYLGKLDEAVTWLNRSVSLNPLHSRTYENLGDAYRLLGEFTEAEKWLTMLDEGDYTLALLYLAAGEDHLAEQEIGNLLSTEPENPLALERAGEIAHYLRDWPRAEELYMKSMANHEDIASNPYAQAPIGVGHILLREGSLIRASGLLNQAADLRSARIETGNDEYFPRYDLALINAIKGNREDALFWLQEAVDAGWRDYRLAQRDPWFDELHDHPKFRQIMESVEHQVGEMRQRVSAGGEHEPGS